MRVNFTDQGLKGVKDVPKSPAEAGAKNPLRKDGSLVFRSEDNSERGAERSRVS